MSGIAGCYMLHASGGEAASQPVIDAMLSELAVDKVHVVHSYSNQQDFCLGISNSNRVKTARMIENEDHVLCANGHFYNLREIEKLTNTTSEHALNNSTTEALLKLYERKGPGLVDYINGIYVIVVWNKKAHLLHIFTDRHGYELLYYYKDASKFIFATEIQPILSQIKDKASVDIYGVCDIFNFSSVFGTRTPIRQIRLFPHAATCSVTAESSSINQYWDYPTEVSQFDENEDLLMTEAKKALQTAVAGVLNGVNDSGIMLSGGLDSRLLAAITHSIHVDLKSFSFKFEGRRYSHLPENDTLV